MQSTQSVVNRGSWGAALVEPARNWTMADRRMSCCRQRTLVTCVVILAALWAFAGSAVADEDAQALARKLSNPVASLISVPAQFNYDRNIGPAEDGDKLFVNVQPVIPMSINADWNVISRTILPLVTQDDIFPGAGSQSGLGDTVQSLFFSPVEPTSGGWIWGAGPVFLLPTATDDLLGADQWGIGPTGVVLRQQGHWTYGLLANHIWGVAGSNPPR